MECTLHCLTTTVFYIELSREGSLCRVFLAGSFWVSKVEGFGRQERRESEAIGVEAGHELP
ncbi:hypothetical protein GBA52_026945 [Prunus armeniaca]|nr:hypothetical protein GBA52_026945 [Prunus armeniaca]